jgi:autotransporter-associated beta strand protein
LGGNNTFNGLVINQGTVRVDSELRLGSNPGSFNSAQLTLDGGTLENSNTMVIDDSNRGITLGSGGGTFLVDPATTLTVANVMTGTGGLIKSGAGTLILNAVNTFIGTTTNTAGTLLVNGRLTGPVVALNGSTLMGNGIVAGTLLMLPGSTLSPGSSLGTLTVSNTVTLLGNTIMEVDAAAHSSDLLKGSNIVFGGTLSVSNLNGSFAVGDSFKIFDAPAASGAFTSIVPSTPGQSLAWDTSTLTTDGTLRVIANLPQFSSVSFSAGGIVFSGSHGSPGGTFSILTSTNAGAPITQWFPVSTNSFDLNGNFRLTNAINPSLSQLYYLIQSSLP